VRSFNLPRPIPEIGAVIAALAKAGVFRLRGILVGTVAYQTYAAMLGVRLSPTYREGLARETVRPDRARGRPRLMSGYLLDGNAISIPGGDHACYKCPTTNRKEEPR
jgi:hypothetical protein